MFFRDSHKRHNIRWRIFGTAISAALKLVLCRDCKRFIKMVSVRTRQSTEPRAFVLRMRAPPMDDFAWESRIHMLFLSITKTFQRIIHRRGSTSGAPPLTTAPLYGVCRVKTSEFCFYADSPRNLLSRHIHVIYMSTIFFCTDSPQNCQFFCCRDSPQNNHTNVTQMCIRAQTFSTYHSKICSDHVLFIPTWIPKRVQDLDLCNEADCVLLSYGAYVYALGCYLTVKKPMCCKMMGRE